MAKYKKSKKELNLTIEEKQQKSLEYYSPKETIKRVTSKVLSKLPFKK